MSNGGPGTATVTGQGALAGLQGSGALGGVGAPAGYTGTVTWTPPGTIQAPVGGVTAGALGRLGFGGGAPRKPVNMLPEQFGPILQGLGPAELGTVRQQLYAAGLMPAAYYGKNALPLPQGALDGDTAQAFYSAAKLAAFTGNLDTLLSARAPQVRAGGGAGQVRQPLVIELPSETDLHAVLKEAAMPLIGREPTQAEMSDFARRFRDQSAAYQRQAYAAGGAGLPGGPGGTVTKPPSGQAAAEEFLAQRAPAEVGAQRMEGGLGILLKMFSGGA